MRIGPRIGTEDATIGISPNMFPAISNSERDRDFGPGVSPKKKWENDGGQYKKPLAFAHSTEQRRERFIGPSGSEARHLDKHPDQDSDQRGCRHPRDVSQKDLCSIDTGEAADARCDRQ